MTRGISDLKVPVPEVNTSWLFPFQQEDVNKLVDRKGSLIANEMGTGKTYEAIALDLIRRADLPSTWESKPLTLVVSPLTVTHSWEAHFKELAPHLKTCKMDPKNRGAWLASLRAGDADVYICHWESLRLVVDDVKEVVFLHLIADEVHRAKNRNAQQTRALKKFRTVWKSALSGTPVTNRPNDLWSILDWLYPRLFGGYWKFYNRYVDFEIQYPQQYHKILGPRNVEELRERMDPFYVRRRKVDVLKDLPEKYYTDIWVELDPKQRKAYDQMKKEMIAWLETQDETKPLVAPVVIAQLVRLQQLAAAYADVTYDEAKGGSSVSLTEPSSKLDALMQILEDNPDEPIVVFSQFKQLINLAAARLDRAGIANVRITGDVSQDDRRIAIEDFQSGSVDVFLGTIGAGGEGITLTRSSTVVFLDRDWSPAKNSQAEDRLHRIGQLNAVEVIDIMAINTVDLGRRQRLEMKKEWIRQLLD